MFRTLTPALMLGLALTGGAMAQGAEVSDPLAKEVRELREEVAALRRLREIDARLNAAELKLLTERLDRIEKSLKEMSSRSGFRSEFTPSAPRAAVGMGTIRLNNRLPVTAYVTIEGVSYSVAPWSVRTLSGQPAGAFSYTITADGMGVGPLTRTTLASGESLTLTIY
jgi:hypothetical protein